MFRNTCAYDVPGPGEKDQGWACPPASGPQIWEIPPLGPGPGWVGWQWPLGRSGWPQSQGPQACECPQPRPGEGLGVCVVGLLALSRPRDYAGLIWRPRTSLLVQ